MTDILPAGMILAGGLSRRMGRDKTRIMFGGRPLIAHIAAAIGPQVSRLLINAPPDYPDHLGYPLVSDRLSGHQGPLAGIEAGLHAVGALLGAPVPGLVTVAGDCPFLPDDLVQRLVERQDGRDRIVVAASGGRLHPVTALWPLSVADDLSRWLRDPENRRVTDFIARHQWIAADFDLSPDPGPMGDPFFNINTPEDLATAERCIQTPGAASQRIFGISGWKNSGKTGLAVRLVEEFTRRGYRISTIKHAHHDFDIDKVGADSYRHRMAGAHEVTIVSGTRYAVMHELRGAPEPSFEEILARLAPCDLVLIEGYKREPVPKIEARRLAASKREPLSPHDPHIVAIAADHPAEGGGLPVFDLNDTMAIADFVARITGLPDRQSVV